MKGLSVSFRTGSSVSSGLSFGEVLDAFPDDLDAIWVE
jgi:hypothetical protein